MAPGAIAPVGNDPSRKRRREHRGEQMLGRDSICDIGSTTVKAIKRPVSTATARLVLRCAIARSSCGRFGRVGHLWRLTSSPTGGPGAPTVRGRYRPCLKRGPCGKWAGSSSAGPRREPSANRRRVMPHRLWIAGAGDGDRIKPWRQYPPLSLCRLSRAFIASRTQALRTLYFTNRLLRTRRVVGLDI